MAVENNFGFKQNDREFNSQLLKKKVDEINEISELLYQNGTLVRSKDANAFVNSQNRNSLNPAFGAALTKPTNYEGMGALGGYMKEATNIMDSIYGATVEPTQKEKDINMGRMALKFFTQMGASASQPGQTALGAANVAGANVAQDYLNKIQSDRDKKEKLELAKKTGALTIASQLKSAQDAKEIALAKANNVKPSKPDKYKILNVAEVAKSIKLPTNNPFTGKAYKEGDIIDLTPDEFNRVPRGNLSSFKEVAPPKPNPFERLRDGIIKDFQIFNTSGTLAEGGISKLLANIVELRDQKLRPIPDPTDPDKTIMTLQQGVNMFDILEKEFGKDAVDKLKTVAGIDITDTFITPSGTSGEVSKDGNKYEVLDIGGTKFTILSSKEGKLGTTEVKSLTNAKSGLKDLKTALSLMFPNGEYNRKLVTTMNLTPDWGLGLLDIMSPDGIGGDAKTTIEAMKRAIEIILRERSGAAVPPAELVNYLKLYLPNSLNNEVQARNKIDALLQYFKGSIDGINKGRQKNGSNADENFFNQKLPDKIIDKTMKDGKKIMGRRVMIQEGMSYIETAPGSGNFQPLVTKSK
jgi:uncharacterized membrane protein YkoI